jgi:hypothetical protein
VPRFRPHRIILLIAATAMLGCHGSPSSNTSPSSHSVTDFASGVTASDGTAANPLPDTFAALNSSGSPPSPTSGGPAVTATANSVVAAGGSNLVQLRASAPFQIVYMSVDGANGFFQLNLPTAVSNEMVLLAVSKTVPTSSFNAVYRVAASSGGVGAPSSIANTVQAQVSAANLELTYAPNPVPFSGQAWTFFPTLHESNGIGVSITGWTEKWLDSGGNQFALLPYTPTNFAAGFGGCGHFGARAGARIEANGIACGGYSFSSSLFPRPGGFIEDTITGTDDRGNTVSVDQRVTLQSP